MTPGTAVDTCAVSPPVSVRSSDQPALSCIVVTYGTDHVVLDCLAALDATLIAEAVPFEVVIVDNQHPVAPSRSRRLLEQCTSGVRLVSSAVNLGFAGGNNLAVQHARGGLLAILNPDVVVSAGWFSPLRAALDRCSIAAPVLTDDGGRVIEAGQSLFSNAHTRPITVAPPDGEVSRPLYASAACWMIERAEFDRLGGFDDGFHPAYYEDVDFGLRAGIEGRGTLVVGSSRVTHLHGRSTADAAPPSLDRQHDRLVGRWGHLLATLPDLPDLSDDG